MSLHASSTVFPRAVGVMIGNESEPASVDAAFDVHLVEIGGRDRFAVDAGSRHRPAIGRNIANFDLGVARTRLISLFAPSREPATPIFVRYPSDERLKFSRNRATTTPPPLPT